MKKQLLALLPALLLSSCNYNIPEELNNYFRSVSYDKAYRHVLNASLTYTSTHYETDAKGEKLGVIGTSSVTYILDKSDENNYYTYFNATYSGTLVTSSTDANNNEVKDVTERSFIRYLNEDETTYNTIFVNNGVTTTKQITKSAILIAVNTFFYTQIMQDIYNGGMYYADYLYSLRKFSDLFKVTEDNKLTYTVENFLEVNAEDPDLFEAVYSFVVDVDEFGMLTSRTATTTRLKFVDKNQYDRTSTLDEDLKIEYNKENLEKPTI